MTYRNPAKANVANISRLRLWVINSFASPEIRLPLSPQKRTSLAGRIQLEARLRPLPATVWIELVNRVLPRDDLVLEPDPEARARRRLLDIPLSRCMTAVVEQAFRLGNRGAGSPQCFPHTAVLRAEPTGCDKLTRRAKFRFRRQANHFYNSRHPVPKEGALAIVTERWDGMRWTRRHRARDGIAGRDKLRERSWGVLTSGAEAYGEVVWT